MTTLTISVIIVFVLGYALIATESLTKVNKAAIALLMLVGCWTLYMVDPMQYLQMMHPDYTGGAAGMVEKVTGIIQEHLGDTATTLFFLMGAMTIVEIVDQNGHHIALFYGQVHALQHLQLTGHFAGTGPVEDTRLQAGLRVGEKGLADIFDL